MAQVNPLAEIERRVQDRAKALEVDPTSAEGTEILSRLVDEQIGQWNLDFKRGQLPNP